MFKVSYRNTERGVNMFKVATKTPKQDSAYVLSRRPREQRTKVKNSSLTLNLTKFSSCL